MNSCRIGGAFLAGPGQEIDRILPFLEGEIGLADIVVQRFHQFLQQEFGARIRRIVEAADHGGGQFGLVELGHFCCPAGYAVAAVSLHQPTCRGKHGRLERGTLFGYQGRLTASRRSAPMLAPTPASPESAGMSKAALDRSKII